MADRKTVFTGSCACGDIFFTTTALPTSVNFCNCVTCRKLSGSPFMPFAAFAPHTVQYTTKVGPIDVANATNHAQFNTVQLSDVATRGACGRCHSPLTMVYTQHRARVWIAVGTIDERSIDSDEKRQCLRAYTHIFGEQRVSWYDISKDGVEISTRFPSGTDDKLDRRLRRSLVGGESQSANAKPSKL